MSVLKGAQSRKGCGESVCQFLPLGHEVLGEPVPVLFMLVEVVRSQDTGKYRHVRFQLYLHQGVDNALRDKFMTVDAPINHKGGGGDTVVFAGCREPPDEQRDFEGTGHLVNVDVGGAEFLEPCLEAFDGAIDDV